MPPDTATVVDTQAFMRAFVWSDDDKPFFWARKRDRNVAPYRAIYLLGELPSPYSKARSRSALGRTAGRYSSRCSARGFRRVPYPWQLGISFARNHDGRHRSIP